MAISRQVVLVVQVCLLKAIRCRVKVACQGALADMVVIRVLREATVALRVPVATLLPTCPTLAMGDIKARISTSRTLWSFTNWTLGPKLFSDGDSRHSTSAAASVSQERLRASYFYRHTQRYFSLLYRDGFEMVFEFCMHVLITNLVPSAKVQLPQLYCLHFLFKSPMSITSPMYPYRFRDCEGSLAATWEYLHPGSPWAKRALV